MAFSAEELMQAVQSGTITLDQAQQYASQVVGAGSTPTPISAAPSPVAPSAPTAMAEAEDTDTAAAEGSQYGLQPGSLGWNVSQPDPVDFNAALEEQQRSAQDLDPEYRAAHPEMWQYFAQIDAERAKYAPQYNQQQQVLAAAKANPDALQYAPKNVQKQVADIATQDQTLKSVESGAWYQNLTPDTAPTEIGGLPTTFIEGQGLHYDTGQMAENLGLDPALIAYFSDPNVAMDDDIKRKIQAAGDAGSILQTLRWLPAHKDAPVDLSNNLQVANLISGGTGGGAGLSAGATGSSINDFLYNKPDESKWYNAENIVPMATLGAMGLVAGGIGGTLAAPLAAAVGGGAAGGAVTGGAAGLAGSIPGSLVGGVQTGDWGGALTQVGMGTLGGAAIGGVAGGLGVGGAAGGADDPMTGIDFNSIPTDDPIYQNIVKLAQEMGVTPQEILDMASNLPQLQQLQGAVGGGVGGATDIFGRDPATDYGYDESVPFDKISDIDDPGNWQQYIKDLYTTGNTEALSALGFMTDSGAALGLSPSNMAIPEGGAPPSKGLSKEEILNKALGLIGTDQQGAGFVSPYDNSMLGSLEGYSAASSGQAAGVGSQYLAGSDMAHPTTQQYQTVRPSGLENYSQDILSMVRASPDILNNPTILNMVMDQLQGGEGIKRFGLSDNLLDAGVTV